MSLIKLRAVRPLHMHGKLVETGDIFSVESAAAAECLSSTRCELVDPADRAQMLTAASKAVLAQLGRQGRLMPDPGSPWRAVN
ncbi:MAG: hypothetical protein IPI08_00640 [Betaproteobacteria bacterium]|jgi:hypothetical protein|nr:hypothetical protein [Betaproteobacteria bacterium]MBK8104709.1 hypothetical protein [Betaproteobacteria bacterium]